MSAPKDWFLDESFGEGGGVPPRGMYEVCVVCGLEGVSSDMVQDGFRLVCVECGAVQGIVVDEAQEAGFAHAEAGRVNPLMPKSTLGTTVTGHYRMKMRIMNDWWRWVYKEKTFYDDKKRLEHYCQSSGLPKAVMDNALNLYKRISESRHKEGGNEGKYIIIRGVNRCALMAASVYYGARVQKYPKSPREIADMFELQQCHVTRGCKRFLALIDPTALYVRGHIHDEARDFVLRTVIRLNLPQETVDKAIELVENVQSLQIASNHQPPSVAGAVLILLDDVVGKATVPQDKIKSMLGVSLSTATKTYKKLVPWTRFLADRNLTFEYLREMDMKLLEGEEK